MKIRGIHQKLITLTIALFCVFAVGFSIQAAEEAGTITELEGTVRIARAGAGVEPAELNGVVYVGDQISTMRESRVTVLFKDESVLTLSPDTSLVIDEMVYKPETSFRSSMFNLLTGTIKGVVGGWFSDDEELARYEVKTPTAVAGIRGTTFVASVSTGGGATSSTFAGLSGGTIVVWAVVDPSGKVYLQPGFFTNVGEGQLPSQPLVISDDMLQDLLEGFMYMSSSLGLRVGKVREINGVKVVQLYLTPDALKTLMEMALAGDIVEDDPSKLIFQEPPPYTPVVIQIGAQ